MKSRTSFYNGGVAKNLLRRFWPLWAAYLALLLLTFSFALPQELADTVMYSSYGHTALEAVVLQNADGQVRILMAVALLSAMAAYSYLYSNRSCGMMNALPIRRETMFGTAYLTGLAPLLLAQLLAMLLAALTCLEYKLPFVWLLKWLGLTAMATVAFYGFAVFCAVLTGNILVLPAVYLVLNLTAWAVESCLRNVFSALAYGSVAGGLKFDFLSPIAWVSGRLSVYESNTGEVILRGAGGLAAYCAAGLVLALLALLIYRRRQMESATDVVAVPILKPVFRYCMAFGTALVFTVAVNDILNLNLRGRSLALFVLVLLLAGAFLGWFIAAMLLRKSFRVFREKWLGLAIVWAVLLVFWGAAEFDLFGYERRVPAPDTVESVMLDYFELKEPENVAEATALHRILVEHKRLYDRETDGYWVSFLYKLKDGGTLERSYRLPYDPEGKLPLSEDLQRFQDLSNCREAIRWRVTPQLPVEEQYMGSAELYFHYINDSGYMTDDYVRLTPEQAISLYYKGILPDANEGHLAVNYVTDNQPGSLTLANVNLSLNLEEDPLRPRYDREDYRYEYLWFNLYLESAHTMEWIRENTDLADRICPAAELYEDGILPVAVG